MGIQGDGLVDMGRGCGSGRLDEKDGWREVCMHALLQELVCFIAGFYIS